VTKEQKKLWRFVHRECPDLKAAKNFVAQWSRGTHQLSVGRQDIVFEGLHLLATMRAMAALVSQVLESESWSEDGWTNYLETKYGSILYHEM
jgi:hypothetical protein